MTRRIVQIPLFQDPDYKYSLSLERITYRFRFYYNERMKHWIMDIRLSDNTPVVLGVTLVPMYPIAIDYSVDFSGFFFLEPIGESKNQTVINPFELSKYYKLYYVWDEV